MDLTNQDCLNIIGVFDVLDQARSQFTPQIISKITTNRFELSDAVDAHDKFQEIIKKEFAKTIGQDLKPLAKETEKTPAFDLKSLQQANQEESEAFYEKFIAYRDKHEGYIAFLEKKVKVDIKPIYLKELEKCTYPSSVMWLLKDKVLFKEKGTIKPSAN